MNDLIKKLAEQAYQWTVNESKSGPNVCAPGSDYFLAMEKEKFAELIVRECIDIAQDRANFPGYPPNDVNDIIDEIKQHFGVGK